MATIHPTAIVDPQALLAPDVVVGPHCIIQGPVHIGPATRLLHRVSLTGPLRIGARNTIYPNACIGFAPQDRRFNPDTPGPGVLIGDDNILREAVTIHRATSSKPTTLGHRNYLMANSHLGHDVVLENDITLANGVLLAGHVHIADHAILGGNAVVHQFCRVGRLAMLSGAAGITQDLPPFCVAYSTRRVGSLNIVGLRRAGYREHIPNLQLAFRILYRENHIISRAAQLIEQQLGHDPLVAELAQFIQSTRRGVTAYGRSDEIDNKPSGLSSAST